jgi:hypothetical protein
MPSWSKNGSALPSQLLGSRTSGRMSAGWIGARTPSRFMLNMSVSLPPMKTSQRYSPLARSCGTFRTISSGPTRL